VLAVQRVAVLAVLQTPVEPQPVDGDGVPEFIYHWNAGDGWADAILRLDDHGWTLVVESVGGSTA